MLCTRASPPTGAASVNCSVTPTGWSSFWVGLDGDTSNTVEQTGTEADCSSGSPVYSAWYEMYPKFPVNFSNPVSPGDHFSGSVATDGRGSFTLTLIDSTKGWTQTNVARLKHARLSSAEVIAKASSSGGGDRRGVVEQRRCPAAGGLRHRRIQLCDSERRNAYELHAGP